MLIESEYERKKGDIERAKTGEEGSLLCFLFVS